MATSNDKLQTWKDKIQDGQRFQQRFAEADEWGRYKDYYRHKAFSAGTMPVNIMFSTLRTLVPQVYYRNPRISITARKPGLEAELNARLVERIDNWLLRELSTKREFKKLIADTFFCGISGGILGYDSQFGLDSNLMVGPGFTMSQFDRQGNRIEYNSTVNPGMPWFLRARPEDIIYPWGATDFESLEWFALRVFRKVSDLRKDKKYSNTTNLRGTYTPKRTKPDGGEIRDISQIDNSVVVDSEWVELWEIHDARTGKVLALTMDHDKWLRQDEDELQIEGLPLEGITFNDDPDYIYGIPDARIIEPQLLELNDIRTQAMRHRRIDVLKGFIRKEALDDKEIQRLTNGEIQALISVESDTKNLADVYAPINPGVSGILNDLAMQGEVARGDIRETVGFSRTAQGDFMGKTHISATETNRVMQSMNIRLDERRDAMAELVGRVVRKWNQIIFTHWDTERVADIIGPDGAQWWLKYTGQQLADEYDLNVVVSEGPMMDSETKKQMAIDAAQAWAQLNQGQISQGAPVPAEIQKLIFTQFEETGLDIDKLLAQSGASAGMQPSLGGMGSSPQQAISPGLLAQLQAAGGNR